MHETNRMCHIIHTLYIGKIKNNNARFGKLYLMLKKLIDIFKVIFCEKYQKKVGAVFYLCTNCDGLSNDI